MAGFTIKGEVQGLGPVLAAMRGMKLGMRNRALSRGITKATRVVRKAAKALAPVDTTSQGLLTKGAYRKSIDLKVSVKGERIVGIVGPARDKTPVKTVEGRQVPHPSNLAFLLEFGHGGPHPAPAIPHMRPAWDANKAACLKIISDECWLEVAKWARA